VVLSAQGQGLNPRLFIFHFTTVKKARPSRHAQSYCRVWLSKSSL
jgi:hypothetical protein